MAEVKSDKGDQREKQPHREGSSFFRLLRASLNQSKFVLQNPAAKQILVEVIEAKQTNIKTTMITF